MDDAAIARAINLHDFIVQDLNTPRTSLLLAQLTSAREEAIEACRSLVDADAFDPKQIMTLQNDVKRYVELAAWLQDASHQAAEIYAQLPPGDQAAIAAFLQPTEKINDA